MTKALTYYLWILGCAMNYSDAERIASVFDAAGYIPAKSETEADVAVVVACSVRQTAIDRIYGKVKPWDKRRRKTEFKTILAGCVLPEDKRKLAKSFDLIFDINKIQRLEEFLLSLRGPERRGNPDCHSALDAESSVRPEKISAGRLSDTWRAGMTSDRRDYLSIVPKYQSSFRAYVPIMTGCDNFCSYCAVPYTRGREKSRPAEDIVAECEKLIASGYKEITLLGQNVNSYQGGALKGSDPCEGQTLAKQEFTNLLKNIDKISGDYRVYFYSNHPKDFSDELIETLPNLKHFPNYIHLPLQSGNDAILRKMNRHYTSKEYLGLVKRIRSAMPEVVLTTDVMVGFPGEGGEEFEDTMKVIREAKFEMIFIGQYSPRPGTLSAKMADDVPVSIKKKRDTAITDYLRGYLTDFNQQFVGRTVKVLIDEKKPARTADRGDKYFGRTEGYKVVEIEYRHHPELAEGSQSKTNQPLEVGRFYDIKINEAKAWKLFGRAGC